MRCFFEAEAELFGGRRWGVLLEGYKDRWRKASFQDWPHSYLSLLISDRTSGLLAMSLDSKPSDLPSKWVTRFVPS